MNITQRQSKIFYYLLEHDVIHIGKTAAHLQVSAKTIRKDLQQLDEMLKKYDSSLVKLADKSVILKTNHSKTWWLHTIPQIVTYPLSDIIKLYILFSNELLTVQKIADALYYTKPSIERIIYAEAFQDFPITKRRSIGLIYDGDMYQRYRAIVEILSEHVLYTNLVESSSAILEQVKIVDVDHDGMQHIFLGLRKYLEKTKDTYTDKSIKQLYLYLIVFYHHKELTVEETDDIETLKLLNELALPHVFTNQMMIANILHHLRKKTELHGAHDFADEQKLLYEILIAIEKKLGLQLDFSEQIKKQLLAHIGESLSRFAIGGEGIKVGSTQERFIHDFRVQYPMAFEAGKIAVDIIKKEFTTYSSKEIEIVYFGMYFQTLLDMGDYQNLKPIQAAIVCEHGFGVSNFIGVKLTSYFSEIEIRLTTSVFELVHNPEMFEQVDIIFCTLDNVYVDSELEQKVLRVSAILDGTDIDATKEKITEIKYQKYFQSLESPLIELQATYQTKEQLLSTVISRLLDFGYVSSDYYESVTKRENLSPTAFGKLAIPHGDVSHVNNSTLVIVQLKEPITWNNFPIELVCLFVATSNDLKKEKNSISHFYQQLADENFVEKLLGSKTREEIMYLLTLKNK